MTEAETSDSSEPPGRRGESVPHEPGVAIELADPQRRLNDAARSWLRDAIARAVVLMRSTGEVRVRIVGDEEISHAHEEYLGEAGTTDVITFDMSEEEGGTGFQPESGDVRDADEVVHGQDARAPSLAGVPGRALDVDILVCIDEAARQSDGRSHPVEQELLLYVVHGILHCLGHDDHDPQAAVRMHKAEDRVLGELGVGATYSRGESPPAASQRAAPGISAGNTERETS